MFDLVVGASSIYGGSWLEGAGAVYAENQALRWIADLVGLPAEAGGVFVPGGTIGNLSALVAARHTARRTAPRRAPARAAVAVAPRRTAPTRRSSSRLRRHGRRAASGCRSTTRGRLTGADLRDGPRRSTARDDVLRRRRHRRARRTSASSTTWPRWPRSAREFGIWFHVDGAYGGAGLAAPIARHLFDGIEHADSFIVDPHKWLFAPFDCCALLYREPAAGPRRAHPARRLPRRPHRRRREWNPTDYSVGLTRRARGLPFWFSPRRRTAPTPTRDAIERTLEVARFAGGRDRPARLRRAAARARPVGGGLPPDRLDAARTTRLVRPAARRASSPSSCRRRTRARR